MDGLVSYIVDQDDNFTLKPGEWYAWQMQPGYGDGLEGYFSPIYLHQVLPMKTGRDRIRISFFNACYADGVRDFDVELLVLSRRRNHLLASIVDRASRRDAVVSHITQRWLEVHLRDLFSLNPPSQFQESLARHELHYYLNKLFFRTLRPESTALS